MIETESETGRCTVSEIVHSTRKLINFVVIILNSLEYIIRETQKAHVNKIYESAKYFNFVKINIQK